MRASEFIAERKKKKSSRSTGGYFFPGYGYYGSDSGEGGGDGGGESVDRGMAEGATVTRIDSKPVTDFASGLKAYKHTDNWSQSGLDTGDDSYWKNKNLKTNTTKGLFAGDPRRTALYATGNAHETRYVEFTQNGQPIVYFDQKDLPAMRSRKTYLTVFDASDFKQLPTGEWFSKNPSKPIKQMPIGDPFKYIASQGWIVRVTDDLDKVFKQVKNMHKAGKIAHYGAEGMNESKQGVAEEQELDEKWSQKYKSSINCANPKGFSQRAHCAGRKKNEDVAEGMKADDLSRYCEELVAEKGWDAAYKHAKFMAQGATDPAWGSVLKYLDAMKDGVSEAKKQPPEAKYDDEYDAMVARVKKLAGLGPMKTVYDPAKRQYRNMPTAQQPKK